MEKTIRVGINGFGRIGRAFLKLAWDHPEIEVVAVNDLGDVANMAYLLKYDTVYRKWDHDIKVDGQNILIDDKKIQVLAVKDPTTLPWKDLNIDVVVESTGLFTTYDKANMHIKAGAKKVVISAPAKMGEDESIKGETIVLGINEDKFGVTDVTSNASCTTNAAGPLIAILHEAVGIEKAALNTIHAYTGTQAIVDGPSKKDFRGGRAAAQNIVPSSTGAAIAVAKVFPALDGLFDGISMRVPVPSGSIVDITFIAKRDTTVEEVNEILKKAGNDPHWSKLFSASDEELVSSDILGESHACIADLKMTRVVGGNLVKVLGWYDNEMGYTHTLIDHVIKTGKTIVS